MDHGHWGGDWGGAAFWLFIAACVIAGSWEKIRKNAEKHETLRRVMEKTGTLDEAKLKELFNPVSGASDWMTSKPGDGYRGLRVAGTILMLPGIGMAIAFLVMGHLEVISRTATVVCTSIAGLFGLLGAGLFFSSRFAEPPPGRNGPHG